MKKGRSKRVEDRFKEDMELRGYTVIPATEEQDMNHQYDFKVISPNGTPAKYDVKSKKKLRRNTVKSDLFTWIELVNVDGNQGWVHGDSDFIAFEYKDNCSFFFMRPVDILSVIGENWKSDVKIELNSDTLLSPYRLYKRAGRKDVIMLVRISDMYEHRAGRIEGSGELK